MLKAKACFSQTQIFHQTIGIDFKWWWFNKAFLKLQIKINFSKDQFRRILDTISTVIKLVKSNHTAFTVKYTHKNQASTYLDNMLQFINDLVYHRVRSSDSDFGVSRLGFHPNSNHTLSIAGRVKGKSYDLGTWSVTTFIAASDIWSQNRHHGCAS